MNKASQVREWIEIQLLDCQNLARQHGLAEVAQTIDETLDLLDDPVSLERLKLGRVLPPREQMTVPNADRLIKT